MQVVTLTFMAIHSRFLILEYGDGFSSPKFLCHTPLLQVKEQRRKLKIEIQKQSAKSGAITKAYVMSYSLIGRLKP